MQQHHKEISMKHYIMAVVWFLAAMALTCGEAAASQKPVSPVKTPSISGQVKIKGKIPMANGIVLLFNKDFGPPPHPYKYWRIPDKITETDKNGKFTVEVQEGTYYLMIAQKKPSGEIGPPVETEFLYFHGSEEGVPKPIVVSAGSKVNLGLLSKAFVWSPNMVPHDQDITAIEGTVVNMENKPVANAVVFAYFSSDAIGKPAFVSDRTDKNGGFQLRVYDGDTYYLKVRSVIGGGAPAAGEYQSATEEFVPVEVSVKSRQQVKNVVLKVDKFTGQGSTGTDQPDRIWKNTRKLQSK